MDFSEDFLLGDINDPYTHTQISESHALLHQDNQLSIIDIGPRTAEKLFEFVNNSKNVILWGETGCSRVKCGRDYTMRLLKKLKNGKDNVVFIGGEIENFVKNIMEWEEEDDFLIAEDEDFDFDGGFEGFLFMSTDFLEKYAKFKIGRSKEEEEKKSKKEKGKKKKKENEINEKFEIFIGGLPSNTTKESLLEYFSQFGEITKCSPQFWNKKASQSKISKCKGFGMITCKTKETYEKILDQKLHEFQDRKIECKEKLRKTKLAKYSENLVKRKVFISGLPSYISSEKLEEILTEEIGELEIAYVIKHRKSKKSRGFGFVVFKDKEDKEKLLEKGYFIIKDRKVSCTAYEQKDKGGECDKEEKQNSKDSDGNLFKKLEKKKKKSKIVVPCNEEVHPPKYANEDRSSIGKGGFG